MHTPDRIDWAIARLGAQQHAILSLEDLVSCGLTERAVRHRVAAGRLHRIHHGVFSLVPPSLLTRKGRWMAAVRACGPDAVLSHWAAAALHGIRPSSRRWIDVTSPQRTGQTRKGIKPHTSRTLLPRDITTVDGIPCTSVARTLLDIAPYTDVDGLERAIARAEELRIFDGAEIDDLLTRSTGHRGAPKLRVVLNSDLDLTPYELERRMAKLLRRIPGAPPERNVIVEDYELDFAYRAEKLNIETDGGRVHGTTRARKRDAQRDRALMLRGWRVARYSWAEVAYEADRVTTEIRALLSRG